MRTSVLAVCFVLYFSNFSFSQSLLRESDNLKCEYLDSSVISLKIDELRVAYQRKCECPLTLDALEMVMRESYERILSLCGGKRLKKPVWIYFPEKICDGNLNPNANLNTNGMRLTKNGKNSILMQREAVSVGLCSHELLHAWFFDHGIRPKTWWLEEGLCEFAEHGDGFHAKAWELLQCQRPFSKAQLSSCRSGNEDNDIIRASAWLLVYHARFVHPKRYSIVDYATISIDEIIEPEVAFQEVEQYLKLRERFNLNPPA